MRYNCLRTNQYVKMFVVGLLLYLGEAVFFKCSEEETFTVNVKTPKDHIIELHNCKKTDTLNALVGRVKEGLKKNGVTEKMLDGGYGLRRGYTKIYDSESTSPEEMSKTLEDCGVEKNSYIKISIKSPKEAKGPHPKYSMSIGSQNLEFFNNVQPQYMTHKEYLKLQKSSSTTIMDQVHTPSRCKCIQCCLRVCFR